MTAPTHVSEQKTEHRTVKCPGYVEVDCFLKLAQVKYPGGPWSPARCQTCTNELARLRGEGREAIEREQSISRREVRLRALNIPPIYARAALATFEFYGSKEDQRLQARAHDRAALFIERWDQHSDPDSDFPQIVVFRGAPGSGKGHLGWAITKAIVSAHDVRAEFDTCANIIRDLRQSWGRPASEATELDRLKHYRELDLLVIDEVSRHALYGEPTRHLYDLLAHREQWLRPTIITTNETLEELGTILQDALVSRIEGWGGIYEFGAADYRIERRKRRAKVAS